MKRFIWISVITLFLGCAGNLYIRHHAVEVISGDASLIVTVPHDGYLVPTGVPVRSDTVGCELIIKNDLHTRKLGEKISKSYQRLTGKKPTLIINHIHRKYADMNRSEDCGSEHPLTRKLHRKYSEKIKKEVNRLLKQYNQILHIDLHGHISDSADIIISTREHSSIQKLYEKYGDGFFYGEKGILTNLELRGYNVKLNEPFTGGHTIYFVPELNPGLISSIQFEIHSRFRHDNEKMGRVAQDLVEIIMQVERMTASKHTSS